MSVLIETSLGYLTLDLSTSTSPLFSLNFLKLCKLRYYDKSLFFNLIKDRFIQTGDPTGTGSGGQSVYGLLTSKSSHRFIKDERVKLNDEQLKCKGICFTTPIINSNGQAIDNATGSQFCVTTNGGEGLGLHEYGSENLYNVFGRIVEDQDGVLEKINECYVDEGGRPYADVRIESTTVLYDPWEGGGLDEFQGMYEKKLEEVMRENGGSENDTPNIDRPREERLEIRISVNEDIEASDGLTSEQKAEALEVSKAKSRAVVLEMLGDLKSADDKPPENVLFVCKLNGVTNDDDLELIFSRFDPQCSAEIMRDRETGDSLNYGFVAFQTKEQAQEAFFKMNNALVDDRRIKVDFSQSVKGLWKSRRNPGGGGRGGGGGGGRGGGRGGGGGGRGGGPLRLGGYKPKAEPVFRPPEGSDAAKEREKKRARSESESSSSSSSSEERKKKKKKKSKKEKKSKKHKKHKKEKKEKKSKKESED
ncbi:hypothetical protein TrVE_jg10202 [Triparma verrucosa]|uniref:Peptidyl-prolyl cis-trans isomerase n=1 Tax=Triparma verrucosa TaxID=1606542 RepID=A0A9W7BDW3_9STRA|nr:hypothetical protein TrVE_jg10202 [Triparma verrucosa]